MGNEVAIYQTLRWAVGRLEIRKITACDRQQFQVRALGVLIDLRTDQFKKPFVPAFKSLCFWACSMVIRSRKNWRREVMRVNVPLKSHLSCE